MEKVIIFNAVPSNNGDAALVFSLFNALNEKGYRVKIAAHHYDLVSSIYKDYPIIRDLTDYNFFKRIPYNKYLKALLTPWFFLFSKEFMTADAIVSSPGGYINSYYGFSRVAMTLMAAKVFGKKTAIYAQSIGPLNKRDRFLLRFVSRFIDIIYARDRFSFNLLREININVNKYFLVEDGAFLIPYDPSEAAERTIGISVRSWKHDARNRQVYYSMMRSFVELLIKAGYNLEFISTCQGLSGYVDDSKIAKEIIEPLDVSFKQKIIVNDNYYRLDDLLSYIGKFQAVIGTRLHMCILSMLKGKPCFNISYEIKGKEAYTYLGLDKYTIDYNEDLEIAEAKLKNFIDTQDSKRVEISKIMPKQNAKAQAFFNSFIKNLLPKKIVKNDNVY